MASLHAWRSGDLPEKREALYAETVDLLLNRWEQRLVRRDEQGRYHCIQPSLAEYLKTDKDQVRAVLEALAFEAQRAQPDLTGTADIAEKDLVYRLFDLRNNPDANPKRLVEYLRDRAGLLYPRGVGVYTFPHRSFQEYLAACHLTDEDYPDQIAKLTRAEPNRWREVALLAGRRPPGRRRQLWQLVDALCSGTERSAANGRRWGAQIAAQALIESVDLVKSASPTNPSSPASNSGWSSCCATSGYPPPNGPWPATTGRPGRSAFRCRTLASARRTAVRVHRNSHRSFMMGSDKRRDRQAADRELPQHEVNLPGYYLARWPVTVAQFAAFVGASGHAADPDSLKGIANHPVVWVDWHDAWRIAAG